MVTNHQWCNLLFFHPKCKCNLFSTTTTTSPPTFRYRETKHKTFNIFFFCSLDWDNKFDENNKTILENVLINCETACAEK